jgi:hypothetical protein
MLTADMKCEAHCADHPEIDCEGYGEEACPGSNACIEQQIALGRGARLDLGGHALRHAYEGTAVICGTPGERGTCTIVGPGSIIGGKGTGISGGTMDVVARNLTIDFTDTAVGTQGSVVLQDVELGASREDQVVAGRGIRAVRGSIGPAGFLAGGDLVATGVGAQGSAILIAAGTVRVRDMHIPLSAYVAGLDVFLRRVTSDPYYFTGVANAQITADRSLRLMNSSVATIQSGRRPRLSPDSTCEWSRMADSPATWDVCASD